jgi:glycosyltransferase involved in cell wall biosynthesis
MPFFVYMKKLSIVTINLNNKVGLEKTIQSVVNQSFSNYEYIVVDGGSVDGSIDVIKQNAGKITYWVSEPDRGIYHAMNKGINCSAGEYLLFINSGDLMYSPDVLEKVFNLAKDVDVIYGDLHRMFPDNHTDIVKMPDHIWVDHLLRATLTHPSTFIKRSLFGRYGKYREDIKVVADWAFFLKIFAFGNVSQQHVPITIASFDMNGVSSNHEIVKREREKILAESFSSDLQRMILSVRKYRKFYDQKLFRIVRRIIRRKSYEI